MQEKPNPIGPFLDQRGFLVVDGGLATELEHAGFDLDDPLWSARLLVEAPEAIADVHRSYLEAGADCIISASYQATVEGFMTRGLGETEAVRAIRTAVEIAIEARDLFWAGLGSRKRRFEPLVAASVGPFGAYLANGAEFTGDYDLDEGALVEFHRQRWEILSSTGADLLACETIPSLAEARALATLLSETPEIHAWFSFSCRDGEHISDGTPIIRCVEELESTTRVVAIGVNCTAPGHIASLVGRISSATDKPIVVYPNSGEGYDVNTRSWSGSVEPEAFASAAVEWHAAGARLLGGCCRTRPEDIRQLRQRIEAAIPY
jgi:homocysteine S-methyltransferase